MATIGVTGGGGFIGRHFVALARIRGHRIHLLSRSDIGGEGIAERLRGVATIIHLAARAHNRSIGAADSYRAFHADNVELTQRVGDACLAAGVPRLIFVSSAGVLGQCSPAAGFTDTSPPAPHDAYTRSKFAAEELLRSRYAGRLDTVIIRPPVVYGPGATGSFSQLMRLASTGWPLPFGTLNAPRSLISVRNLCDLLLHVAENRDAQGLCMLAADAETTSIAELFRLIRDAQGRPSRLLKVPSRVLATALWLAGRQRELVAITRPFVIRGSVAREAIGWTPQYRLENEIYWTARNAAMEIAAC